ncbi:Thioredoxin O1, mitochondrial [Sesamum angolense]|uniref:Thioredoxin O1, mitochondrial n=1 Tax=Sesamum angolense TaxID=2727404 RepID=A0AAE1WU05_9LAMI|nr:Thioredoxin O1, mitochondrial [Sesamum angolense]
MPSILLSLWLSVTDPSNVVYIESEEQFNDSLRKVQDESLPAVFYFTAVWCGPCRLLSPIIGQLSEKYPHVTTYKIDIDKEGLGSALSKLNVHAVPTLHFFQNGKKASEVIGADVQRLKDTMEALYK